MPFHLVSGRPFFFVFPVYPSSALYSLCVLLLSSSHECTILVISPGTFWSPVLLSFPSDAFTPERIFACHSAVTNRRQRSCDDFNFLHISFCLWHWHWLAHSCFSAYQFFVTDASKGVSTMFPGSYVPRYLCSSNLCSPVPMFPGTDVPRFLYFNSRLP